jgi:methyl-accepting chemotaxis protein
MASPEKQTSINTYILLLIFVVIMAFTLMGLFQYRNLTALDHEINSLNDQLEERTRIFVEIQQNLGYGGVIHNLKNYIIRRDSGYYEAAVGKAAESQENLEQYRALSSISDEETAQVAFILHTVGKYQQALDYIRTIDLDAMSPRELDAMVQVDDSMAETALEKLKTSYQEYAAHGRETVLRAIFISFSTLMSIMAISIFIFVLIMAFVALKLRKRTAEILKATSRIGEGDLRTLVGMQSRDFMGRVTANFDSAITRFRKIITGIRSTVQESDKTSTDLTKQIEETIFATNHINGGINELNRLVGQLSIRSTGSAAAAEEIEAAILSLARNIENQVSAVTETSAAIEEMAASIKNVAGVAETRMSSSRALAQVTGQGEEELQNTDALITGISSSVDDMQEMITVIENIASQTDMLSMNAAIEAAHAGDAGKGFAVVADEIRKLAESTRENSRQISGRLTEIIGTIRNALESSRSTKGAFIAIRNGVDGVLQAFSEISGSTQELSVGTRQVLAAVGSLMDISGEITNGSDEMKAGAGEISRALRSVEEIVGTINTEIQGVSRSAADIAAAAMSISDLGIANDRSIGTLMNKVADLQLDDHSTSDRRISFSAFILQHHRWVARVGNALAGIDQINPEEISDHHGCEIGRWMDGPGAESFSASPLFTELTETHEKLHHQLREIILLKQASSAEEANRKFNGLIETSRALAELFRRLEEETAGQA